jgi:hypothetical protein
VDEVSIGGWFYLEHMSSEGGVHVYALTIGDALLHICAPKNADRAVTVQFIESGPTVAPQK